MIGSKCRLLFKTLWILQTCFIFVIIYTSYVLVTWTYTKRTQNRVIPDQIRQTIVILFTNKRSGSTFLGELFNSNLNAFYMFEPLFPFTRNCDELKLERVAALKQLVNCNFTDLHGIYQRTFQITEHSDQFAKCMKNNICFVDRQSPLIAKYNKHCLQNNASRNCGLPLIENILSSLCSSTPLVVFKILRICEMKTLLEFFENMESQSVLSIKIVHLIRDPRAILTSRLKIPEDDTGQANNKLSFAAKDLCSRLLDNTKFANMYWKNDKISTSYLRKRHEDITTWPFKVSQEIYDFIGQKIPIEVNNTIKNAMTSEVGLRDPFAITRRSNEVLNKWRHELSLEQVKIIQEQCSDVMDTFGYVKVDSLKDLKDENMQLW